MAAVGNGVGRGEAIEHFLVSQALPLNEADPDE
jgi:hypothetical protein